MLALLKLRKDISSEKFKILKFLDNFKRRITIDDSDFREFFQVSKVFIDNGVKESDSLGMRKSFIALLKEGERFSHYRASFKDHKCFEDVEH